MKSSRLGSIGELLAVGGATPLLLALSWIVRRSFALDVVELGVGFAMFHLAFIVNDPHFGVTYVLFYKDLRGRALGPTFAGVQRARYIGAAFVVPAVLVVWSAIGVLGRSPAALGALFEAMFMLVGWHYVKQGFGVTLTLAARRGVTFRRYERLALLAHCLAGWIYAWANPSEAAHDAEVKGVVYTTLAHPRALEQVALVAFVGTGVLLAGVLVAKWKRDGALPLFTPLVALVASVWAWSIWSGADPLVRYMVPALHSIQYLYFVALLKGNEAREREVAPYFDTSAKARLGLLAVSALVVGWVFFHGAPSLLDDALVPRRMRATDLGATPYFAAIYAFVNIHHYFMDTVIWRRENPLTRYLRAADAPTPTGSTAGART